MLRKRQILLLCAAGLLSPADSVAQPAPKSAGELIRELVDQSKSPERLDLQGLFECGISLQGERIDRALISRIVDLGPAAVPAVEEALDSFEERGNDSEVAPRIGVLTLAWAKLKGPAAYPRLRRIYNQPAGAPFASELDNAVAVAFGLTSWVSALSANQLLNFTTASGKTQAIARICRVRRRNVRRRWE